ncbi:MAG: alanine racemase [Clostridiaceae bacterium]|nr:alanine racemase [Bacillota bacterium]NLP06673.1 alanine racemase [Clostridiaceae bacterium]HOA55142.1 alanine racemase [Clostridiales bacterium]HQD31599.1 alanine racemase [Clostridiales bacterium]
MDYKLNRAWAEIDLDAIAHNTREIKKLTGSKVEMMGVVKADAYGHGVLEVVRTLLDNGVTQLAVSMLDEAIQIRKMGIDVPILVLNYTDPARADEIIHNRVTQTVFSTDLAQALSAAAVRLGKDVRIHVKVDTGMTRVGFIPGYNAVRNIMEISRLPGIILEGIFTHFASADESDKSYTLMQFERFMNLCTELTRAGIHIPVKHVCNSAGILQYPEMHLDIVRPGIILYGLYPSREVAGKIDLRPAMTLKANVIFVKDVDKDTYVSYGRTFRTDRKSRIATIPIGYADGYTRLMSNKGRMLVNGEYAPVIGRICMDQCMLDVTDLKHDVHVGDEVVIFGRQNGSCISVDEIADQVGTINYELVCIIGKRIPRVYLKEGKICGVLNYLI